MEGADLRTDGELLVATATDPEAFGTFFRRHVRGVLAFFRRRGASAEVALDLTAETFAAVLEASPRYELRPAPARNWLYGTAWNKLHEAQRRGRADDAIRRALGMVPIVPTHEGIERIGDLAGVNRVVSTPQPGPETALSRAAERDPATPNHVWITPRVGGPHANSVVHFRVLLTGADYSYRLSGAKCPAITVSGGGTDDLHGRIWSGAVDAVQGQAWCPGTYHVSVSTMGARAAS